MTTKKVDVSYLIETIKSLPKAECGLPLKSAFNPMALPTFIPYFILAKVPFIGSVVVLLSGEGVDSDYGAPLKGVDIFDITSPREKKIFPDIHRAMFEHPCALFTSQRLEKKSGLIMPITTHSFPLCSDDGLGKYLLMYFEHQSSSPMEAPYHDKFSAFTNYSDIQFLDIGHGAPGADKFKSALFSSAEEALGEIVS